MSNRIFFFDLLRFVAAIAVVAIHALGPYRHLLGEIPTPEWIAAVGLNSLSRWAVPVFIMITGALMLSDKRPFDPVTFFKRRLGKVLVPFLVWSLFYAWFSGWSISGYAAQTSTQVLLEFFSHPTYYHLGFFYYFLPLYFVVPVFKWLMANYDHKALAAYAGLWLLTTTLFLFKIDGPWSHELWLYAGYLLLGWYLYHVELTKRLMQGFVAAGIIAAIVTVMMVIEPSLALQEYKVGRWLSYKTINTIVIVAAIFIAARYFAPRLSEASKQVVSFVSQYSLGVYLLHPIFLWPMIELEWYRLLPAWLSIPLWTLVAGSAALWLSWVLAKSSKTRWLTP
ncbi:acyltransferase [Vibrio sp. SCSIO 43136]|uniref:acyltransferase n=1 Tax=Vibrio sp. SCSIO 43136 TaxID=2819101 RepID=UPI0020766210|nr:acyltransferase [Vibrio sp. SCSIO 43136]USD65382.1 acyltransferase [Vibrio sp. SCSIO 43136]